MNTRKTRPKHASDKRIIATYRRTGSILKTAVACGAGVRRISRLAQAAGILKPPSHTKLAPPLDPDEVLNLYQTMTIRGVARHLHACEYRVRAILVTAGALRKPAERPPKHAGAQPPAQPPAPDMERVRAALQKYAA